MARPQLIFQGEQSQLLTVDPVALAKEDRSADDAEASGPGWGSVCRPTSVNIRTARGEGTWATQLHAFCSSIAILAVSPQLSTSPARYGRAQEPSIRPADSPSRIIRGPRAYRLEASWRT